MTLSNAGSWPAYSTSRNRFEVDGKIVEVQLDWRAIKRLAQEAAHNKTGRVIRGPLTVKVVL